MDIQSVATSPLILVTGPARSGKSEWAERLAIASHKPVIYVATASVDPTDLEWQARIEQHRLRRPTAWETLHVPIDLPEVIQQSDRDQCLLIDSLGTWLANLLEQDPDAWTQTQHKLLESLQQTSSQVIIVAEETGWGVVPAYPIGRTFRDRLGGLVQRLGAIASAVYLVTGGYALPLSSLGIPLNLCK